MQEVDKLKRICEGSRVVLRDCPRKSFRIYTSELKISSQATTPGKIQESLLAMTTCLHG